MSDGRGFLERLKRFVTGDGVGRGDSVPPEDSGGARDGCEEIEEISCEEAVSRVYEFLDGELEDAKEERIRCHVLKCERCYPYFNWERVFLANVREKGAVPRANPELKEKVRELLDSVS